MNRSEPAVGLRLATPDDERFLRDLYASVREPEFAPLGLEPAELGSLLAMQFTAQDRAIRQRHPGADFDLVLVDGEPAGRLYVDRGPASIHVIQIELLPEYRGRGLGTRLLRVVLDEAAGAQVPVTLKALRTNPAIGLYRRLGFTAAGGDDVYLHLERRPPPVS